eukprot:GHRR01027115.1.p2 GENE.GHRR01027115.1~~GHRR01027115.1.p2  ORF type:complete len:140 (+),score=28.64 GHRR01027115.1:499-918(+)
MHLKGRTVCSGNAWCTRYAFAVCLISCPKSSPHWVVVAFACKLTHWVPRLEALPLSKTCCMFFSRVFEQHLTCNQWVAAAQQQGWLCDGRPTAADCSSLHSGPHIFVVGCIVQAIWLELQETVHAVDSMSTKTPAEAAA